MLHSLCVLRVLQTKISKQQSENAAKSGGGTAIHIATEKGYVDMVRLLVQKGAKVMPCRPRCGFQPMHLAVRRRLQEDIQ